MDFELVLKFMYDFAFFITIFAISLTWAIFIGRQSLINILVGSYLAILFFNEFPLKENILHINSGPIAIAVSLIVLFVFFVFIFTYIIKNVMPLEFYEGKFENISRKVILAGGVTVLYSSLCFTILPMQDIVSFSTPLQALLTSDNVYYYSLLVPLGSLAVQ